MITREIPNLQYTHQWAKVGARYDFNRVQRLELGVGVRRIGVEWQSITRTVNTAERKTVQRSLDELPAGRPVIVAETDVAFVRDTAVSGPTSPVIGQRLRFAIEPSIGSLLFTDVHADARRYFMPVRPVTLAVRAEHVGRYGRDAGDTRLTPLMATLQARVRGYALTNFAADGCGRQATSCSLLDQIAGSRIALLNVELRAPVLGLFDRPNKAWTTSVLLRPGF